MIAGLSKAVTLYLATLLSLTAMLLTFFAFLAPVFLLQDRVALLSVNPSTVLQNKTTPSSALDGPTLQVGALGESAVSGSLDEI